MISTSICAQPVNNATFINCLREVLGFDPLLHGTPRRQGRPRRSASSSLVGQTFGGLDVVGLDRTTPCGHHIWTCRCRHCGNLLRRSSHQLRRCPIERCRRCRSH